jgi:hypothetical protein
VTERYIGEWTLARSIADADNVVVIACQGDATLRREADTLRYEERVTFVLGGKLVRATRAYRFATRDGTIRATFDDGSPFFELVLDPAGTGSALHVCGADRYVLTLTLREPDRWATRWDVSGGKHQQILTHYARPPALPETAEA